MPLPLSYPSTRIPPARRPRSFSGDHTVQWQRRRRPRHPRVRRLRRINQQRIRGAGPIPSPKPSTGIGARRCPGRIRQRWSGPWGDCTTSRSIWAWEPSIPCCIKHAKQATSLTSPRALGDLEDPELMLKFVRDILEITHGRGPTVVNRIIFAAGRYGHIDKSLIIFEELKRDQRCLDVVTFNTVLDMLGKAGRVDQMLHEVKLMEELGHSPDIVTYNTVINCLRWLGRFDLCKSFATEMFDRGICPDLRTYSALIDGFGRAGRITEALEVFEEMKMSHQPSIYVYRALISDLKKAGRIELAQKLLEEMNSRASDLLGPEDFKQKFKGRRINKSG